MSIGSTRCFTCCVQYFGNELYNYFKGCGAPSVPQPLRSHSFTSSTVPPYQLSVTFSLAFPFIYTYIVHTVYLVFDRAVTSSSPATTPSIQCFNGLENLWCETIVAVYKTVKFNCYYIFVQKIHSICLTFFHLPDAPGLLIVTVRSIITVVVGLCNIASHKNSLQWLSVNHSGLLVVTIHTHSP